LFVVSKKSFLELESDSTSDGREVRSEYSDALSGVRVWKCTVGDFMTGGAGATDGIRLGAMDGARLEGATWLAVVIGIIRGRVSWAANFLGSIETDIIEV
jgi:hypothetical protein